MKKTLSEAIQKAADNLTSNEIVNVEDLKQAVKVELSSLERNNHV